jgi:hypothetical protein
LTHGRLLGFQFPTMNVSFSISVKAWSLVREALSALEDGRPHCELWHRPIFPVRTLRM